MKITIRDLSKEYPGGKLALDNVNLDIESGMFGLLGPNGAGKTTLMRILVTLQHETSGTVKVGDYDLNKNRKQIRSILGYLPQEFSTFSKLRTWEFLDYSARLCGIKNTNQRKETVDRLLKSVGLFEARDRQANRLSGGMKRRLGIAQALIGDPKILVVDEPTIGLDPEERLRFRNLLAEMSGNDIVIILSTHIVGDISSTCHKMALLNNGKVVYNGSPERLISMTEGNVWAIDALDHELERIKQLYPVVSTIPSEKGWEVEVVTENPDGFEARPVEPNLEHAYVYFLEGTPALDQQRT